MPRRHRSSPKTMAWRTIPKSHWNPRICGRGSTIWALKWSSPNRVEGKFMFEEFFFLVHCPRKHSTQSYLKVNLQVPFFPLWTLQVLRVCHSVDLCDLCECCASNTIAQSIIVNRVRVSSLYRRGARDHCIVCEPIIVTINIVTYYQCYTRAWPLFCVQ